MGVERADPPPLRRVLMTADTLGGVWDYSLQLAQGLGALGVEVVLATLGAPLSADQWEAARGVPTLSVYESRYRLEWMDDPWDDVRASGEWLLELAREVRPDVVQFNGYAHASISWDWPVVVVGHSCVLSWWEAVRGEAAPPGWDRYRREVARGLRAADLVVAPTRAMLAALERHYGRLPAARVVPNGRPAAGFRPGPKEPFSLAAGRLWDEAKGISDLASIAPRLEWPTYVAGEVRHPDGGEVAPPGVRMLGRLSSAELGGWLARASLYVLPARYEPFGLSALEAALAGCALVLGDIPSLREIWGEAATFVAPGDREGLLAAIRRLIAHPRERDAMVERARERALEYTPERMAATYRSIYGELTSAGGIERRSAVPLALASRS